MSSSFDHTMDGLEELTKSKKKSSLNTMYFEEKYDIPSQVDRLPIDNVLSNPSSSVNLPPPLPGVFIFDQPNQNKNNSQIDSNFNPHVTSSYDTLSNIGPPISNQYSEVTRPVPEMNLNQKYFQPQTISVYDYQSSEQKRLNKLQPIEVSDVDTMLPPQGNAYQSLQPVPVNVFDTSSYCEPKVYQQLEPVSRAEYRVDMEKFVEQKFYQELNPLSVKDSKMPKNEKKTYQQLRSVPDLHFIGGQSDVKNTTRSTQQTPEIPPEYATSKLYQQLSKPPKKQVRLNHHPEVKSYHQLGPATFVEKPKHDLSKSLSQPVSSNTFRPVTTQTNSKVYHQHQNNSQTYHRQPYETFQNVKVGNYGNDPKMTDPTINLSTTPNLSFPNKTQTVQRGFQENKPKVYLELRNPVPVKQSTTPSGSLHSNFSMDLPHQGAAPGYDDSNVKRLANTQYQHVHPLQPHLQVNDKQPNVRLHSPFEFKLPQTNTTDDYRMPRVLGPNEYNGSQNNSRAEQMLHSTNRLLKSSNKTDSNTMTPPYYADNIDMSSLPRPKVSVCFDNPSARGAGKFLEDINMLENKREKNNLPTQMFSDVTPDSVPHLTSQTVDRTLSNGYCLNVSTSAFENEPIHNLSNSMNSAGNETNQLTRNEVDLNCSSNTLGYKVLTDKSFGNYNIANTTLNLERISTVALENCNGSFSEIQSNISSPDLGHSSSTENFYKFPPSIDSNPQGLKEKSLFPHENASTAAFVNTKDLSNTSINLQSANNEVKNVESLQGTTQIDAKTRVEEKLENFKPFSEEPTDLSINSHTLEKNSYNNSLNKDSPISTVSSSAITKGKETLSKITKLDKLPTGSDQVCFNSSQSAGALSTGVVVKGESRGFVHEETEFDESVMSQSTEVFCKNDLLKTEASQAKEKPLNACQSDSKHKSSLRDQILNSDSLATELLSTVEKVCTESPNDSLVNSIESVVSSELSESHVENKNECKVWSESSVELRTRSDLIKKDLSESENNFTPVMTASKAEKSVGDLCENREVKEKLNSENVDSPEYTSFIPKKNRILYKTQLLSRSKSSKVSSEISMDITATFSVPEKNSVLSKTSRLLNRSHAQSESHKTVSLTSDQTDKTPIALSVMSEDNSSSESTNPSEQACRLTKESFDRSQVKVDGKNKIRCESTSSVFAQNNLESKTQPNVKLEKLSSSVDCVISQSNTVVKSLAKSKWKYIQNEDQAKTENNKSQYLKNVSSNDPVLLKTQSREIKEETPMSKERKILQSENSFDHSQTPQPIEKLMDLTKLQVEISKVSSQTENCNTNSSTNKREKEENVDKTAEAQQFNTPQSTRIVSKHSVNSCLGTRSSMKRKPRDSTERNSEPDTKRAAFINDSKSPLEGSVKSLEDAVKNMYPHRVCSTDDPGVEKDPEKKADIDKSLSKDKTQSKGLSSNKSLKASTLQEKTSIKMKRKYSKRKKFETMSTVKKAEPLLKSKYSKRIIKKKKLDFEPIEPVKKPRKLLKRRYTITKYRSVPIKKESSDNQTTRRKSSPLTSAKIKYEFVDPLESTNEVSTASKEGLITDDEGEATFLGFDSPEEEDDTVLGFDFKEEDDDDLEPINEFLLQLDADSMTVECDPRTLLHAPGITTQCPQCGKALDSHQELVDHMQCHTSQAHDSYVCCVCLRGFGTQAQLDKHTKWSHEGGKRFSCPVCSKRFTTSYYVKKHLATVHGQHEAELKYICPECTLSFTSEKKLSKHVDKVHNKTLYQCNKCLKNFLKLANLERHMLLHKEEGLKFPCAYCNEKFDSRAKLHAHWPVHSEKKLFTCEICNSNFTALPSLRRHKILHAGEKLFRCDICQKSFALMSTLKTHLLVHSGIKRFPCKLCDKVFNRQDVLNAHQWIHTGEKKFECDICFQKFRWRHAVKSHKLIYHSTEKPYVCEICGKRFSHPESFKKHGEVHAEKLYYCQICLKAFSRPSSLKIHILVHTDLKPFVCDLCDKGFRHKSHLRKHFLVHTSEKPWLCKFCNRMYKDRSQLRRHKRVVHCKNFFKTVLPDVPESLKTVENFEMIAEGGDSLNTNKEYYQESDVLDSENPSKHFILSNLEASFSNSKDNSVPDSVEDKFSNAEDNEISSPKVEDHLTDPEENDTLRSNTVEINSPLKQVNVLPPSAF